MKKFPWRLLVYLAFLLYLFLDLRACNGPLRQAFSKRHNYSTDAAKKNRWVALVNQEPISRTQLDIAVFRHLYQRGKEDEVIPEKNLRMIRRAVLQQLIEDTLIRQYADGEGFTVPQEEIDAFIAQWESQFESEEEIKLRSEDQFLSQEERNAELARIWTRKRWLETRIEPGIDVTEEEMEAWYEANRDTGTGFIEPEKVRARHLFVSTVEVDDEAHEQQIREMHRRLTDGEATFEELAKLSEDPRTKNRGGDLNWFTRDRMPEEFAEVAFALNKGDISEPFRTSIGWHIVEVTDRQEERPLSYEEIREDIRAHLENQRAEDTVKQLLEKRSEVANIRLFPENL
jgi:parvulin-like peptidyl-prolyl isomerase